MPGALPMLPVVRAGLKRKHYTQYGFIRIGGIFSVLDVSYFIFFMFLCQ
jgi:hypothetical protein